MPTRKKAKRKKAKSRKAPKRPKRKASGQQKKTILSISKALSLHGDLTRAKKNIEKADVRLEKIEERLQDIEIHVNLLTRLLTTLCIEKFGMRVGVLKRIIKRIEKEAIRDSQILHLESIYKLPSRPPDKKGRKPPRGQQDDPWDDIS